MLGRALLAAGLAMTATAQVATGTAVWCVPSLLQSAVIRADECGWPVEPLARQRAATTVDAAVAAAVRLNDSRFIGLREGIDRMARDHSRVAGGAAAACAASRPDVERFLALLSGPGAEAVVRESVQHSRAATTMNGQCV